MVDSPQKKRTSAGSQTLSRGLDILEAVSDGTISLMDLSNKLGLSRSTTHRIATTMVERRYIKFVPREGYSLGAKLMHLGSLAQTSTDLVEISRPFLKDLAAMSGDTVCLGVLDGWRALYVDRVSGSRCIDVKTRIGERQAVISSGLGKALLLDSTIERWREFFQYEVSQGRADPTNLSKWLNTMNDHSRRGYAFDLEENMGQIRCVAAPIWAANGSIAGAISVSSAAQYMDDLRIRRLSADVTQAANTISRELGWNGHSDRDKRGKFNQI